MPKISTVSVSQLEFDLQNPRNDPQESQRVALETMLLSEHKKSAKLAEHIVEYGQNPIDLIAVIKSEQSAGKFTVLEGNRRAAVLKVLNKPVLLDSMPTQSGSTPTIKKLKALAEAADPADIKKANVVLFDSREDANVWIALKHTGENEGAGTVGWDGIQSARFRKGNDAALAILEFGKAKAWFDDPVLNEHGPFPISTLNRLIGDPDVRKALGLTVSGGKIEATIPPDQLARGVKRIVTDLANRKITVSDVKRKPDRSRYIDSLPTRDRPDLNVQVDAWTLDASSAKAQAATVNKVRPRSSNASRNGLLPSHFIVTTPLSAPRLNKIYRELKTLSVNTYPNAVAVLLRAFIELSLDEFIARNKVKVVKARHQATLTEKITAGVTFLKDANRLDKSKAHTILRIASEKPEDKTRPASVTTLHAFVHALHASPVPSELKDIWDDIEPFMKEVLHAP